MYRLIFRAKSLHNSWPPSTVMTPKSTFQTTTLNRQQPSDPSTFNVVLETSVTRHPLWERSISIPHWWGEVCVYLGPLCARVCVCKRVSHIAAGDTDSAGLLMMSGRCVCLYVWLCCTPQCTLSVLMRGDVRAKTCRSASTVQSFPVAALDQRALVKPWTWTSWVWKNLSQNNYNLSKHQRHACSFQLCSVFLALSRGQTRQAEAPFFNVVIPRKKISVY